MPGYLQRFDAVPAAERWPLVHGWMHDEPLPFYAELRKERPILVMPEVTLAARFDDCTEILRRHDLFSVALYPSKQGDYFMAQDDTATHLREKSIMQAILDREDLPLIRTFVANKTAELFAAAGGTMEAVAGLSRAVPLALVQEWFGFVNSDAAKLCKWSYWSQIDTFWNQPYDSIAWPDPSKITAAREAGNAELAEYLIGLVTFRAGELKSGRPGKDPTTRLLELSLSHALNFDMKRVVKNVGGLLIGTIETTSHAVVNAIDYLLQHPDILAKARAAALGDDPAAVDGFAFEALRFKPAFPYFMRMCEKDTVLGRGEAHETPIPKGTTVLAITHSAMFDPEALSNANEFDTTRGQGNQFHFGHGLHECLGRSIGQAMIPEIVRQSLRLNNLSTGPVDRKGGPVPESWEWRWNATTPA